MGWYDIFFHTITDNNLGDYASVLGLLITAVGFPVTIWKVLKSKAAAEAAKQAVEQVKEDLATFEAATKLSETVTALDEIKDLHREAAWKDLPRRYSSIRKSIIELRTAFPYMSGENATVLQRAALSLKFMEEGLDKASRRGEKPNVALLNRKISDMQDRLNELVADIKTQLGK